MHSSEIYHVFPMTAFISVRVQSQQKIPEPRNFSSPNGDAQSATEVWHKFSGLEHSSRCPSLTGNPLHPGDILLYHLQSQTQKDPQTDG